MTPITPLLSSMSDNNIAKKSVHLLHILIMKMRLISVFSLMVCLFIFKNCFIYTSPNHLAVNSTVSLERLA